jgi:putative ABC transport system permease protein
MNPADIREPDVMSPWRLATQSFLRGLRAGRLTVLMLALTVAVAAITSVGFFIDRVRNSVEREAASVLAADLRIRSNDPLSPDYLVEAEQTGLVTAEAVSFATVVMRGDESQLSSLQAVSDAYPLRGQVQVADSVDASSYPVAGGPAQGTVWPQEGLLARLGARVGDDIRVGAATLRVDRVLEYQPDQSMGLNSFAPTLLMNLADLPATDLIRPGSRPDYSQLFAGNADDVRRFRERFLEERQPGERLQTAGRTENRIQFAIDRAESYLSLASMITLLLAATAVAVSARRYAATQVDGVALMKCLGSSQTLVLWATVLELGIIGVVTGVVGSLLGYVAQFGLAALVADLMAIELPAPSLMPALSGVLTSLAVLAGFALPAMLTLRTVPPLRVLRHDAAPKPLPTAVSYGAAVAAVLALLVGLVGADELLVVSIVGLSIGAAALYAASWLMVRMIGPLRHGASAAWRYGLANIARRKGDSIAQVMAFGFGLTVLLLLSGVRTSLLDTWYTSLPEDAPNNFMIDIQRDETEGIRQLFESHGRTPPEFVPMVRGRLTSINGEELSGRRMPGERNRFIRDVNLTWAEDLDPSNELVAGEWWTPGTEMPEISIEEEMLAGLGLALGDRLGFDIGGIPLTAEVTSVRRVEWDSLSPNFFLVLNPAALEDVPATFIASVYAPDREVILELQRRFPSVTVIDLDALLAQIRSVMDRAALAIQYVFAFTLVAGIVVLLAAVQATREERRFEVALLRTLGARRRRVFTALIAEFVSLGTLAGLLAALIATGIAYLLATRVFELEFSVDLQLVGTGVLAGAALVGLAGILATYTVVGQPPMRTLAE